MLAFIKGMSPSLAVEMGRRAIPEHVRPSFQDSGKSVPPKGRPGGCGGGGCVTSDEEGCDLWQR